MIVPIIMLRRLQLGSRDRWAFRFLLFVGFCTIATTAARSTLIVQLSSTWGQGSSLTADPTKSNIGELLANVEMTVALIAASLPSLRAWIVSRVGSSMDTSKQSGSGSFRLTNGSKSTTSSITGRSNRQFSTL